MLCKAFWACPEREKYPAAFVWVHGKYDREDLVREVSENFQGKTKREGQAEREEASEGS